MTTITQDLSVDQFVAGKLRQKEDKKVYNFNSEGYDLEEAASIVKALAKKHNKTVDEVEGLWKKAKKSASDSGHKEDYAYITGILKKMLGEASLIEGILNIKY